MIIKDRRVLKAISNRTGWIFDTVYKYCVTGDDNRILHYKDEMYKLKYFDGCFYPYCVKL